jgi:hypothetical protein
MPLANGRSVTGTSAAAGPDLYNVGTLQISSDSPVGVIGPHAGPTTQA